MKYGFAFQRQGGPMSWRNGPPVQARGADAKSLGSLGDATLTGSVFGDRTLVLPKPGAPEVLPQGASLGDITVIECRPGYVPVNGDCVPWYQPKINPAKARTARLSSGKGSVRKFRPTTSMKGAMGHDGIGDCGCGCGGSGGCGGGKISIRVSDSMDDLMLWSTIGLGLLTAWAIFKKP